MTGLVLVDDRLLHGRITHGWCPSVRPDRIVIGDDAAAEDEWQRETYESSGPDGVPVDVLPLRDVAAREAAGVWAGECVLLLLRSSESLSSVIALGFSLVSATIGELHHSSGRTEVRPGVWASPAEVDAFDRLRRMGIDLVWQALPTENPRPFPHLSQ